MVPPPSVFPRHPGHRSRSSFPPHVALGLQLPARGGAAEVRRCPWTRRRAAQPHERVPAVRLSPVLLAPYAAKSAVPSGAAQARLTLPSVSCCLRSERIQTTGR